MLFGVFVWFAACEKRFCFCGVFGSCPDGTKKISNMKDFEYSAAPEEALYLFLAGSSVCPLECDKLPENAQLTVESKLNKVLDIQKVCPRSLTLTMRNVTVKSSVRELNISNLALDNVTVQGNECRLSVKNLEADLRSLGFFKSVEASTASFNLTLPGTMPDRSFDVNLTGIIQYRLIGPSEKVNLNIGRDADSIIHGERQVRLWKAEQRAYLVSLDLTCSGQTFDVSYTQEMLTEKYPTMQISMYNGTYFSVPNHAFSETALFRFEVFGDALIAAGPGSHSCSIDRLESSHLTYKIQQDSWLVQYVNLTGDSTLEITADDDRGEFSILFAIDTIFVHSFENGHLICSDSKIELSITDFWVDGCTSLVDGTSTFTCNTTNPLRLMNSLSYREATVAFDRVSIGVLLEVKYELSLIKTGLLIFDYAEKTSNPMAFQLSYAYPEIPTDDQAAPFLSPAKTRFFVGAGYSVDDASFSIDPDVKVDGFSPSACLLDLFLETEQCSFTFELTDYPSRVSPSFCYGDVCQTGKEHVILNHNNFSLWQLSVSKSTKNIHVYLNSSMVNDSFDFGGMANVSNANLNAVCLLKNNRCKFVMSTNVGLWNTLSLTNIELTITQPDKPVIDAQHFIMRNESYISQETINRMKFCPAQVSADLSSVGNLQSYCTSDLTIVENHLDLLNISMNKAQQWVFSDMVGCYMVTPNDSYLLEHRAMKLNVKSGDQKKWHPVSVVWNVNSSAESPAEINIEGKWPGDDSAKLIVVDSKNTDLHISSEDGTIPLMFIHAQQHANITLHNEQTEMIWTHTLSLLGDTCQIYTTTNTNEVRLENVVMSDSVSTRAHNLIINSDNIVVKSLEMRSGRSTFHNGVVVGEIILEPSATGNFSNSVMSSSTVQLQFDGTRCALMYLSGNSSTERMPNQILVRGNEAPGSNCKLITAFQTNKCNDLLRITELESSEVTVNGKSYKASLDCQDRVSNSTLFLATTPIQENPNRKLIIAITISCSVVLVLGLLTLTIVCIRSRFVQNEQTDDSLYVDLVDNGH